MDSSCVWGLLTEGERCARLCARLSGVHTAVVDRTQLRVRTVVRATCSLPSEAQWCALRRRDVVSEHTAWCSAPVLCEHLRVARNVLATATQPL